MTRRWSSLAGASRRDDGASLVLAMIVLMCVGLVAMALAGYVQAGIVSTRATQYRQRVASDAAGALDVAINTLRTSKYASDREACPADGLSVPGKDGSAVRVTCSPATGTGVDAIPTVDLRVYLAAFVCADTTTACATAPPPRPAWRSVARAIISLSSADPVPAGGGRAVRVTSWHLLD